MNDLSKQLDKLLEILRLDINNLRIDALKGPLAPARATALVNYIKVLASIQDATIEANDDLASKSPEELKALAEAFISDKAKS